MLRSIFTFFTAAVLAAAADTAAIHVRNFDKVNDHIYRGGEPGAVGVQELGAMGVATIIDLRKTGEGTDEERHLADKLKIKYINIPMGEFAAPTGAQITQVLSLLHNQPGTLFVHCRRGKDRTGTVIACYRIEHDHWENRKALEEAKQHGMSSFERAMQSYILHFSPVDILGQPAAGGLVPVTAAK